MKRIGMAFTLRAGKYSPLNNDKGLKRISLEKWNGINKDTLFWTYRNEFIVHKRTPALTLTTTKLYPDTLIKYGIKTETRKATGENNVTGMLYYIQQEKSSKSLKELMQSFYHSDKSFCSLQKPRHFGMSGQTFVSFLEIIQSLQQTNGHESKNKSEYLLI